MANANTFSLRITPESGCSPWTLWYGGGEMVSDVFDRVSDQHCVQRPSEFHALFGSRAIEKDLSFPPR